MDKINVIFLLLETDWCSVYSTDVVFDIACVTEL